jgi:hypothetical protein
LYILAFLNEKKGYFKEFNEILLNVHKAPHDFVAGCLVSIGYTEKKGKKIVKCD